MCKPLKARIRTGAYVSMNHQLIEWPPFQSAVDTEFSCAELLTRGTFVCTAYGFGLVGRGEEAYGNGPVTVKDKGHLSLVEGGRNA